MVILVSKYYFQYYCMQILFPEDSHGYDISFCRSHRQIVMAKIAAPITEI